MLANPKKLLKVKGADGQPFPGARLAIDEDQAGTGPEAKARCLHAILPQIGIG
jgi:hypothetical protein